MRAATRESDLYLSCACQLDAATVTICGQIRFFRSRASNRISPRDAMAASIAIHADLMNTSRPVVLAVVGMVRCIASSSRCFRAKANVGGQCGIAVVVLAHAVRRSPSASLLTR